VESIVEFILELEKLKGVTRKVRPLGLERYENSAEHSWQLALLAVSLADHAEPGLDLDRVVGMLLVHDIGEIDAGDVMVFTEGGWAERQVAERAAVERIFGLLPSGKGAAFLALWEEFEAGKSAEARFARAVDRAMPVLLNLANDGQSCGRTASATSGSSPGWRRRSARGARRSGTTSSAGSARRAIAAGSAPAEGGTG